MSALPRSPLTRRRFLRVATIVGGSTLLAACQQAPAPAAKPAEAPKPAGRRPPPPTDHGTRRGREARRGCQASRPGGTLNYAESADFNDFNPWSFTAVNFAAYNQIFSRLFWKDGTGRSTRTSPSPGRWRPTTSPSRSTSARRQVA